MLVRNARRVPEYSKFGDHEIKNPEHKKVARCTKCRKTFEWKGTVWKQAK
jgi:hypothetical protein